MEKLEFCAVQDCYEDTESAQYAHVFLPAGTWAEKSGVMTNTERRVNLVKPIIKPIGDSKPDFWIFTEMAKRFNVDNKVDFPATSEAVFEEMEIKKAVFRKLDKIVKQGAVLASNTSYLDID